MGGVMQECWGGSERWVNAGEGDKNDWFVFFKQDEREQEQPQQNNNHNNTDRGEKRKGEEEGKGTESTKIDKR